MKHLSDFDRFINENFIPLEESSGPCDQLKICQGKKFTTNYLERISDLYYFLHDLDFDLVKYGISDDKPPAPAPTNSPYPYGAKVAFEWTDRYTPKHKIRVSQGDECVKTCPQIYVLIPPGSTSARNRLTGQLKSSGFARYSIFDDQHWEDFKRDIASAVSIIKNSY